MKKIIRKMKQWNEFVSLPFSVFLFWVAPDLYRLIDPNSGAYDSGFLHALVCGIIIVSMGSGIAFLLIRLSFPRFYGAIDHTKEEENNVQQSKQNERCETFGIFIWSLLTVLFAVSVTGMF